MKGTVVAKVDIDVDIEKLTQAMKKALALTGYELQERIREAQVIPRDTGDLQGVKFFVDDSEVKKGVVKLCNEGPYARRLYYHPEYNFRQDKNAFAQGLWFTLWQEGGIYQNEPLEIYDKILASILGGKL